MTPEERAEYLAEVLLERASRGVVNEEHVLEAWERSESPVLRRASEIARGILVQLGGEA